MRIKLSPTRNDSVLTVFKNGNALTVNGEEFDFSRMVNDDTLPRSAINSPWFAGSVDCVGGELVLTLLFPIPWNYSQAQAFPVPLENVPDGLVEFPGPLSEEETAAKLSSGEVFNEY